jgi:1-acyl-sn-glycerol-3-phosphate acyltransferase
MNIFRTLVFYFVLMPVTFFMCLGFLWSMLMPRRFFLGVVRLWLHLVALLERSVLGLHYHIEGQDHVPLGAVIIAAKHQSAFETFKIHLLFDDPAIVLKRELLHIPFWGWYLRAAGGIAIDRSRGLKALKDIMREAKMIQQSGRPIIIFPQGTRVKPLEKRPYKNGAALLYDQLQLPIVPLALNSGDFWPKHSWIKKPGHITLRFLPAIPPGLPREEMMARLAKTLDEESDRLSAGTTGQGITDQEITVPAAPKSL